MIRNSGQLALYIKAGWPVTRACLPAALALTLLPANLWMDLSSTVTIPLFFLLFWAALAIGLTVRFAAPDSYTLSLGTPPARRLAFLLLAYAFHTGVILLAASVMIWFRLRSLVQDAWLNPFYPSAAFVDDTQPLIWLQYLAGMLVCCLEVRLRLAAHFPRFLTYSLASIGIFNAVVLNMLLVTLDIKPDRTVHLVLCVTGFMLFNRLVNLFFIWPHTQVSTQFDALRPLPVRIADALFILGWPLIFLALFTHDAIRANLSRVLDPTLLGACYIIYAFVVLSFIAAFIYSLRSRGIRAGLAIALGLALLFFPLNWLYQSARETQTPDRDSGLITLSTSTPHAAFVLDGVTFQPASATSDDRPVYNVTINRSQLPSANPALTLDTSPQSPSSPYAFRGVTISQKIKDPITREIRQLGLALGSDSLYLDAQPEFSTATSIAGKTAILRIDASAYESNRRQQPLVAWMLLHPSDTTSSPLIQKLQGQNDYLNLLRRLPTPEKKLFLNQLHADAFNHGVPLTPEDNWHLIQAIVHKIRYSQPTDLETDPTLFRELVDRLTVDKLAILLSLPLIRTGTVYSPYTPAPPVVRMLINRWMASHENDPVALRELQATVAPLLIAHGDYLSLALIGGPIADRFFRSAAAALGARKSQPLKFQAYQSTHPLIMGALMPGSEGERFRQDYAQEIVTLLTQYRQSELQDEIHLDSYSGRYGWFYEAMGPIPQSGESDSIRQNYWAWFLARKPAPSQYPLAMAEHRLSELAHFMLETRVQPYLDVLADPASRYFSEARDLPQKQLIDFARQVAGNIYVWSPLRDQPDKRDLFNRIFEEVMKDPVRYGLPAGVTPTPETRRAIDEIIQPQHPFSVQTPKQAQTQWLTSLKNDDTLTPQARQKQIASAIQAGYLTWPSVPSLATQENPSARKAAIDIITRWPTPENLTLLNTLVSDPDSSIAAYAKSAQAFIANLKSLPLEKIPAPFTPQALTFFDLPEAP